MGGINGVFDHVKWQTDTGREEEVVGLIHGRGYITRLINQARSASRFDIGPTQFDDVVSNLDPDAGVHAFYHSHPTGNLAPSIEDQLSIRRHFDAGVSLPWLIVSANPYPRARLHWVDPSYSSIASYDLLDERLRVLSLTSF